MQMVVLTYRSLHLYTSEVMEKCLACQIDKLLREFRSYED